MNRARVQGANSIGPQPSSSTSSKSGMKRPSELQMLREQASQPICKKKKIVIRQRPTTSDSQDEQSEAGTEENKPVKEPSVDLVRSKPLFIAYGKSFFLDSYYRGELGPSVDLTKRVFFNKP